MGNSSTTTPVWILHKEDKAKWLKKHKQDVRLVKKFNKFEASVTDSPYPQTNPNVKQLKGSLKDVLEYKLPPVRGLYMLDEPATTIRLVDFNYKGKIEYR